MRLLALFCVAVVASDYRAVALRQRGTPVALTPACVTLRVHRLDLPGRKVRRTDCTGRTITEAK